MRKFRDIVEDIKAPSTNDIWFNNGELKYYGPKGWTPFVQNKKDDSTDNEERLKKIESTLSTVENHTNENTRTLNSFITSAVDTTYLKQAPKDLHIPVMSTAGKSNAQVDYAGTLNEWYQNNIWVDADNKYDLKNHPMYLAIHHHIEDAYNVSVGFIMQPNGGTPVGWRINPQSMCIEFYEIYANSTLMIVGKFDFKTGKYTSSNG